MTVVVPWAIRYSPTLDRRKDLQPRLLAAVKVTLASFIYWASCHFLSLVTRVLTLTFEKHPPCTRSFDPAAKTLGLWRRQEKKNRSERCLPSNRRQSVRVGASVPGRKCSGEMDGGNPSLPSTTSLVPLSHKAVPSGRAVITHFTALILITANVNIRIININAQNNAVICNYRVALIFISSPSTPTTIFPADPRPRTCSPSPSSSSSCPRLPLLASM